MPQVSPTQDYRVLPSVDEVLKDPAGHRDFLWKLMATEELHAPPDDVAMFIGYSTFDDAHVFVQPSCSSETRKPVYIYLDYALPFRGRSRTPAPGRQRMRGLPPPVAAGQDPWADLPGLARVQPVMTDAISRVTRACSGKVFPVYSPADLAAALGKTDQMLSGR